MKKYITSYGPIYLTEQQSINLEKLHEKFDRSDVFRALEYDMFDTDQEEIGNTILNDYRTAEKMVREYSKHRDGYHL